MDSTQLTLHYYGADWCGACKKAHPSVLTVANRYGVSVVDFDYDMLEEEEKATIKKLPTVRVVDGSNILTEITTQHADMLDAWMRSHVRVNTSEDF